MKSGWTGGMTKSTEATVKLGENFSKFIEAGDVFAFIGELASGKTTFIKGILKGLDQKQWQLTNIVKLRVAGMEDARL